MLLYFVLVVFFASCGKPKVEKHGKVAVHLEDSLVLHANAHMLFSNHVVFYKSAKGYYFIDYNEGPVYGVFDKHNIVAATRHLNVDGAYDVNIVQDTFYISGTNALYILSGNYRKKIGFTPALVKESYIYSVAGYSDKFYREGKFLFFSIPRATIWPKVALCSFVRKGDLLKKVDTCFAYPYQMTDSFYYDRYANYDFDKKGNLFYCYGSYNFIYKKEGHQTDSVDLSKILSGFHASIYPIDSFYNLSYLNECSIKEPRILTLRYDKYRNLVYLFVKMGQPLEDEDGNLNDRSSADVVWVVLDTSLKKKRIFKLKKNYYTDFSNVLIEKRGVGLKRKSYDHKKVVFDMYAVQPLD